jgi:hypothetical protein
MTVYVVHSTKPAARQQRVDTAGDTFDKNGAQQVDDEFKENRGQHPGMMALLEDFVKEGMSGCDFAPFDGPDNPGTATFSTTGIIKNDARGSGAPITASPLAELPRKIGGSAKFSLLFRL